MKKKITFLIAAAVMLLTMFASPMRVMGQSTVTIQYPGGTTTNMTGNNDAATVGLTADDWSVVGAKGGNSNFPGLNKDGSIRLYYHADGSNTITVTNLHSYTISSIVVTYKSADNNNGTITVGGTQVSGSGSDTEKTYTINATSFVIGNGYTSNTQVQITSIVITYITSGSTTYTVAYNANGGTGTMTDSNSPYNAGSTVTVLDNDFTRDNYTFSKWNTASNGSGTDYNEGATFTINANTTLYAQWTENGGGSTKELTFDLSSNPGGWPDANSTTLTDYTYTLGGVDYTFALKNVKCNSGYLMMTQVAVLGLPAIENYKLTKVVASNSGGCSTSTNVGISSSASSATYITGGTAQTWNTQSSQYTYNLTSTDVNTMYYMYVTNKNAQVTSLTLTYEAVSSDTPSITASNLDITYDATSGSITYSIENAPTPAGTLTANTSDSWLNLGTVTSTTVPFTCSANTDAAARTATVTLTYTYNTTETVTKNVTVTQAGNPNIVNNISDITATGTYTVQGTIVAISNRGFILGDGTGYVYYYYGSSGFTPSNYAIGDKKKLSGSVTVYGGVYQFGNSTTITTVETSNYVAEDPTVLTGAQMDARVASTTPPQLSNYIQYQGTLSVNGTYYNITDIDDATTAKGSISFPLNTDFTSLNGKIVTVTGYYVGISTSTYYNTMIGSVEEVITDVATPTFSPAAGAYAEAQSVTMSCETTGASIYYTTNGDTPDNTSTLYTKPINVTETTTIKAIAYVGSATSAVATATYTIVQPLTTMDEIFAAATAAGSTATPVVITCNNWVVTGVKGSNVYVTDGTKGFIVYQSSHGFAVGDVLNGTVSCNVQLYKGASEITGLTATTSGLTVTTGGTVTPVTNISIADLSGVNTGAVFSYGNLTYNGTNLVDENNNSIKPYSTFYSYSFQTDHVYNVTGVYIQYDSTKELAPRSAADIEEVVAVPSITLNQYTYNLNADGGDAVLPVTYTNMPANPQAVVIFYEANGETPLTVNPTWITATINANYNIAGHLDVNEGEARSAYFKVRGKDANNNYVYSNLVTINQAAAGPNIEFNNTSMTLEAGGESGRMLSFDYSGLGNNPTFSINYYEQDGTTAATYNHDWLTASIEGDKVNISSGANTGAARTAYFKVYGENGTTNTESNLVTINQEAASTPSDPYVRINAISDLADGAKVIIAARYDEEHINGYYAMPGETSGKPTGVAFTSETSGDYEILPTDITSSEDTYYWTVNVTNDGYTFTNANNDKIGYSSSTNFATNTNTTWAITHETAESTAMVAGYTGFVIKNGNTNTRAFAFNGTAYGAYATSNMTSADYNFFLDFFVQGATPVVTPSITVTPALVSATTEETNGTLAITYTNLDITEADDFDIQFYDGDGNELTEDPDWIAVYVVAGASSDYEVSYLIEENTGDARYAYFKVYAMDSSTDLVYSNLVTVTQEAASAIALYSYSVNGVEGETLEATVGETITLATGNNLNDHFTFAGWTTNPNDVSQLLTTFDFPEEDAYTFYAVYAHTTGNAKNTKDGASYVKVTTDLGTDWAGDYLIAYSSDKFADGRIGGSSDDGSMGKASVRVDLSESISNNSIPATVGNTYNVTLEEISSGSNTYVLKTKDGRYNYQTSNANGLTCSNNKATAEQYPISVSFESEDDIRLALGGDATGAVFRFNTGTSGAPATYFRFYKNCGQQPVYLYKYTNGGGGTTTDYYTRVFLEDPAGNVTIAGPSIIPNGTNLTASITNDLGAGSLIIEDGAQLIHTNNVNATLQKNISGYGDDPTVANGWYLISSPVAGLETSAVEIGTYDLFAYEEAAAYWWSNTGSHSFDALQQGIGYLYANAADQTLNFAGTMVATNASVETTVTAGCTYDNLRGYNLVGNPFTCNLENGDIKIGATAITSVLVAEGGDDYVTVNLNDDGAVKPGQGFMVQSAAPATLTLNPGSSKGANSGFVRIVAGNETATDKAYINVANGNTLRKISLSDNTTQVYVMNDDKDYAAARVEELTGTMPVHFKAAEDGEYTITIEAVNADVEYMHLIDNFTGEDIDLLLEPSYTFNATTNDSEARFRLDFGTYGVNEIAENNTFAYQYGNEIVVNGEGELQIFDLMGRMIMNTMINGVQSVNVPSNSVYILKLNNNIQKIVVK